MNKIRWNPADRPAMNIKENKGVTYLTYPALEELSGFVHAFSTRLGGVSEGIYSSMNLSFTRGDDENSVMEITDVWQRRWDFLWKILLLLIRPILPMCV